MNVYGSNSANVQPLSPGEYVTDGYIEQANQDVLAATDFARTDIPMSKTRMIEVAAAAAVLFLIARRK